MTLISATLVAALMNQGGRVDSRGLHFLGKNEIVMAPGMRITVKTPVGTIAVTATGPLARAYTWEGATRSLEMIPREERWFGSLGLYFPGPGGHWPEHNGITRAVVEEGQQHVRSIAEFDKFVTAHSDHPAVYRNDGLYVTWGKVPKRRQLDVEVWQIVLNGSKPTKLPGSYDTAIVVDRVRLNSSPLVAAVQQHDLARLRSEIKRYGGVNATDSSGVNPLTAAVRAGDTGAAQILLQAGANANAETPDSLTVLQEAVVQGRVDCAKLLLAHGADPNRRITRGMMIGETPISLAARAGDPQLLRSLLEHGADPNAEGARGDSPLSAAASSPMPVDGAKVLEMLISRGANVDHRDATGMTPLMSAAMFDNLVAARVLVAHGANVNARSDAARSLVWGLGFTGGPEEQKAVAKLQRAGKLDALHKDGEGVLDNARDENMRKFLISKGAKSFAVEARRRAQELMKLMVGSSEIRRGIRD